MNTTFPGYPRGGEDGLHEGDPFDAVAVLVRPVESESLTPVMQDAYDVVAEIECVLEREQVVTLFDVLVTRELPWQRQGVALETGVMPRRAD